MVKFDGNWLCWNRYPRSEIRKTENLFGSIKIFADKDHDNKLTVGIWVLYFLNPRLIIKKFKKILVIFTLWIISKFKYITFLMTSLISNFRFTFRNAQEINCSKWRRDQVHDIKYTWCPRYPATMKHNFFFQNHWITFEKWRHRLTFVKRASNFYHIYAFLSFKEGQQLAR